LRSYPEETENKQAGRQRGFFPGTAEIFSRAKAGSTATEPTHSLPRGKGIFLVPYVHSSLSCTVANPRRNMSFEKKNYL